MKISNYFAKEKMDDASFIQTYIEKLSDLTDEDICWANSDLEEDHEKVQSLLMEMVLSFYATDLVDMKDYEAYLVDKEYQSMSFKELQASLIQLFHNDRVHPDSLIHNGIGKRIVRNIRRNEKAYESLMHPSLRTWMFSLYVV